MGLYAPSRGIVKTYEAVARAMQIKEVMLRAMNEEYGGLRAADILGSRLV
jgi:hypothetical protein